MGGVEGAQVCNRGLFKCNSSLQEDESSQASFSQHVFYLDFVN